MCANISHSYEYGYTAGKLAADWLNTNCSASQTVACALLTKPQSLAVIARANGIIEGLRENCTFAQIVATKPYSDQASAREMTSFWKTWFSFTTFFISSSMRSKSSVLMRWSSSTS